MIGKSLMDNKYNSSRIISRNQFGAFDHFLNTKLLMYVLKTILLEVLQHVYILIFDGLVV